jgi:hypothetical protein
VRVIGGPYGKSAGSDALDDNRFASIALISGIWVFWDRSVVGRHWPFQCAANKNVPFASGKVRFSRGNGVRKRPRQIIGLLRKVDEVTA